MAFNIVDNVTEEPFRYPLTWNSTTGEVLTVTTTQAASIDFGTQQSQSAAITLINNCSANAGKFIGHVPPPPGH